MIDAYVEAGLRADHFFVDAGGAAHARREGEAVVRVQARNRRVVHDARQRLPDASAIQSNVTSWIDHCQLLSGCNTTHAESWNVEHSTQEGELVQHVTTGVLQ